MKTMEENQPLSGSYANSSFVNCSQPKVSSSQDDNLIVDLISSTNDHLSYPSSANDGNSDSHSQLSSSTIGFASGYEASSSSQETSQTQKAKLIQLKILRKPPTNAVKVYNQHKCSPNCLDESDKLDKINGAKVLNHCILINRVNPYCVPIFLGWQRIKIDGVIIYKGPCGKQLTSAQKVYFYLIKTASKLSIDQFSFYPSLKLFTHREPFKTYCYVPDIADGNENIPIPCINELDEDSPAGEFVYKANRIPGPDVDLNYDPEFLTSCPCSDNCRQQDYCDCHGLTKDEAYMICGQSMVNEAGYKYKTINKKYQTNFVSAIFECNERCLCDPRCSNRVVQNGIKHCLQVFKTSNRGWGVRCLHDIPPGSFICLYSGEVIDYNSVNDPDRVNDYIAALDYIEEGRRPKRDFDASSDVDSLLDSYESSSSSISLSSCEGLSDSSLLDDLEDDDTSEISASINQDNGDNAGANNSEKLNNIEPINSNKIINKRGLDGNETQSMDYDVNKKVKANEIVGDNLNQIEDVLDQELINEVLTAQDLAAAESLIDFSNKLDTEDQDSSKPKPAELDKEFCNENSNNIPLIMRHFDQKYSYSVDGSRFGNIGRFLNHSCDANCRIRNIFVNNQDYRFPLLAFFTTRLIRAYEELTWDYHYPQNIPYSDSKPCFCGTAICKGRIY